MRFKSSAIVSISPITAQRAFQCNLACNDNYHLDQIATLTLIVVAIRWTDHRLSLMGTSVKQLDLAPAQLVQKPAGLSFRVPDFAGPFAEPMGSRKALPSGVKVILNLVPLGVAAVNGWPLKTLS